MTVFVHGASCSQVWQTDVERHMSQQCFTASIKVVHLHLWALHSLCFYSPLAAQIISVKQKEKHKDYFYMCYVCMSVGVPLCGFHCTVCMLVCIYVKHYYVGGQKMQQINLWGCASGAPSIACMSIHMDSPTLSCLSSEWMWVNAIFLLCLGMSWIWSVP